ncbi:CDGSH iron-sulfur domain-containing protein [Corynebacteriales bacterium D3-21]|uniref:CDGSH iron-sulfur domain-containing protein n=1 Tax=Speluncibacter jeojiensis TaxID=2710754 RepID=A0A9X4RCG9_9ACTN|nr:CDGSH iron-sulfur domain-containing protein [Corynebacteriales bacterium D3-21]
MGYDGTGHEHRGHDHRGRDGESGTRPRRVRVVPGGPVLIEGPIEVEHDGQWVRCDRFVVALCGCRRSGTLPLCDSSHRRAMAGLQRR